MRDIAAILIAGFISLIAMFSIPDRQKSAWQGLLGVVVFIVLIFVIADLLGSL